MYRFLEEFFENARGRRVVACEFLKKGIRVDKDARIFLGGIELAPVKIARALGVDRRVVIETAREISNVDELFLVFHNLESRAFLGTAASELGFDVIEVHADARAKGIVSAVSKILADEGIMIRQIITDDPDLFPSPVMTIVLNGKLKARAFQKIKQLKTTKNLTIKSSHAVKM